MAIFTHFLLSLIPVVQLDLKSESFTKNQKLHQRTIQNLRKNLSKFTVIISWDPNDTKICPSSIAKYFTDRQQSVKLCTPRVKTRTEYQTEIPVFCEDLTKSCEPNELVEWLGMFSMMADCEKGTSNSYTNTYEVPEPRLKYGQIHYIEWKGFFTTKKIETLFEALRTYISKNESLPWISLYVQGFSDSPVAWGLQEHHYFTNGDNAYVVFIAPSGKYLLCTQKCTNKRLNDK